MDTPQEIERRARDGRDPKEASLTLGDLEVLFAAYPGYSRSSLNLMMKDGTLPYTRRGPRGIRYCWPEPVIRLLDQVRNEYAGGPS